MSELTVEEEIFQKFSRLGFSPSLGKNAKLASLKPLVVLKMFEFVCEIYEPELYWQVKAFDVKNCKPLGKALRAMNLDHYATKVQKKNIAAKSNRRKLMQILQSMMEKIELKHGDKLFTPQFAGIRRKMVAEVKAKLKAQEQEAEKTAKAKKSKPTSGGNAYSQSDSMKFGKQITRTPSKSSRSSASAARGGGDATARGGNDENENPQRGKRKRTPKRCPTSQRKKPMKSVNASSPISHRTRSRTPVRRKAKRSDSPPAAGGMLDAVPSQGRGIPRTPLPGIRFEDEQLVKSPPPAMEDFDDVEVSPDVTGSPPPATTKHPQRPESAGSSQSSSQHMSSRPQSAGHGQFPPHQGMTTMPSGGAGAMNQMTPMTNPYMQQQPPQQQPPQGFPPNAMMLPQHMQAQAFANASAFYANLAQQKTQNTDRFSQSMFGGPQQQQDPNRFSQSMFPGAQYTQTLSQAQAQAQQQQQQAQMMMQMQMGAAAGDPRASLNFDPTTTMSQTCVPPYFRPSIGYQQPASSQTTSAGYQQPAASQMPQTGHQQPAASQMPPTGDQQPTSSQAPPAGSQQSAASQAPPATSSQQQATSSQASSRGGLPPKSPERRPRDLLLKPPKTPLAVFKQRLENMSDEVDEIYDRLDSNPTMTMSNFCGKQLENSFMVSGGAYKADEPLPSTESFLEWAKEKEREFKEVDAKANAQEKEYMELLCTFNAMALADDPEPRPFHKTTSLEYGSIQLGTLKRRIGALEQREIDKAHENDWMTPKSKQLDAFIWDAINKWKASK